MPLLCHSYHNNKRSPIIEARGGNVVEMVLKGRNRRFWNKLLDAGDVYKLSIFPMPPDASRVRVFVPLNLNEMALDGSNFAPEIGWINSKLMWCSHPKNLRLSFGPQVFRRRRTSWSPGRCGWWSRWSRWQPPIFCARQQAEREEARKNRCPPWCPGLAPPLMICLGLLSHDPITHQLRFKALLNCGSQQLFYYIDPMKHPVKKVHKISQSPKMVRYPTKTHHPRKWKHVCLSKSHHLIPQYHPINIRKHSQWYIYIIIYIII